MENKMQIAVKTMESGWPPSGTNCYRRMSERLFGLKQLAASHSLCRGNCHNPQCPVHQYLGVWCWLPQNGMWYLAFIFLPRYCIYALFNKPLDWAHADVSCDDALCTTSTVFQEFRLERLYKNSCLWQRVEGQNIDYFVLLSGRAISSQRREVMQQKSFPPAVPRWRHGLVFSGRVGVWAAGLWDKPCS